MDLLDQIAIFRGCEPSVIISYIAVVRELYLQACTNLKKEEISIQERQTRMLEQWKQVDKHFAKIKYAMLDCWPVGNEPDLMAAYASFALLYSLYKEVCDEKIIRQCYEAAERAQKCDRANLSESQFNEIQQYCDMIENIFFLRHQRSTVNEDRNHHANSKIVNDNNDQSGSNENIESDCHLQLSNQQLPVASTINKYDSENLLNSHFAMRRIKDGPAILAEYGQLTTAEKTKTCEKMCQKRLRPSDFEIKTAQKKLKYQKLTNSTTILTEFEAALLARNRADNRDFEFLRPSDLKLNRNLEISKLSTNTQCYEPKSKLFDICPIAKNLGNLKTYPKSLNSSVSIHQILDSSLVSVEYPSSSNQKADKMASINNVNITDKDALFFESSQVVDAHYSSSPQDEVSEIESKEIGQAINSRTNLVSLKLESYVNEFVERIIHSVIEMTEESKKHSRRNSETIQITDTITSTILTVNNYPLLKQESIVMRSDGNVGVKKESDGVNKKKAIRTRKVLKENINQQTDNVVVESVAGTIATDVIIDSNFDMFGRDKYNNKRISDKTVVVEDYAEMELSYDHIPENFCSLQQTLESVTNSDLSLMAPRTKCHIRNTSITVIPESVAIIGLSSLADSSNKSMQNRKKREINSVTDVQEELNKEREKVHKLLDSKGEIGIYTVRGRLTEEDKIISKEKSNEKFGEISKTLQKLEPNKQQQLSVATIATKFDFKQMENQAGLDYTLEEVDDAQKKYSNRGNILSGAVIDVADKDVSNAMWTSNEVVSSTTAINNQQFQVATCISSGQKEATALICANDFNCSLNNAPMQKLDYTSEMSLMEIIPNVAENLTETLEKSDANEIKPQSESLNKATFFEKYMNFEPPSCKLQRIPEFDAVPLSAEQLLSKSRLFQVFPASSTIPNQIRHHEYISDSKKKVQDITEEMNNSKEVLKSFPDIVYSNSGQTKLRVIKSIDVSIAQTEFITEPDLQQQRQVLTRDVISSIAPPSQVIPVSSETIITPRTDQELATEFQTNEYVALEQKIREESSELKSKSVLKETFDYDDENPGCQASSSQETELLDTSESISGKKIPELKKSLQNILRNSAVDKEQQERSKIFLRNIWDAENKKENIERMNDDRARTSSIPMEVIQIPHFDAKAEFDRRLSVKKSHRGEMPIIVKNAILKSDSKLQLSRRLIEDPLISSALRLSANEKPDFNFIIKKIEDDNDAAVTIRKM
ncbi:unnamed protein product [Onchocerca ochengi]|uniref:BUB1 N-terminal domain-containing protein n=1 Tax=Onchocerca ochengi TaxID=42157 RepID=A0A182ECN5_ONCOC|nr:unnamed protein product [Onchocerca ochengi]